MEKYEYEPEKYGLSVEEGDADFEEIVDEAEETEEAGIDETEEAPVSDEETDEAASDADPEDDGREDRPENGDAGKEENREKNPPRAQQMPPGAPRRRPPVPAGPQQIRPRQKKKPEGKKKGLRFGWILIILIVIAVPTASGIFLKGQIAKLTGNVGTPVEVETAYRGSISQTVELSGSVQSEESKSYFAPVSAKIASCDVKAGDIVKAGDPFLTFDVEDLEQQLEKAKLEQQVSLIGSDITIKAVDSAQQKAAEAATNYTEAEAYVAHYQEMVGKISAQLAEAGKLQKRQAAIASEIKEYAKVLKEDPENKKALKKTAKLNDELKEVTDALKAYDVDQLQSAYETCSADLAEYKALKEQYKAAKETDPTAGLQKSQQSVSKELARRSTDELEEMIETAKRGMSNEFEGVVTAAAAQEGMSVQEGMELFSVQSTKKLKVTLAVGKNDLEKIQVGQNADIKIGEKEYKGRVQNISRIASTNQAGAVSVDVDVHIDNPDDGIIIGTEGKVTIRTADKKDIVLVPMICLNYASDSTFVYVVRDKKLVKAEVETGISNDEVIEILSGVNDGDEVVKNVTADLEEGMDVIPSHEKVDENGEKETDEKK